MYQDAYPSPSSSSFTSFPSPPFPIASTSKTSYSDPHFPLSSWFDQSDYSFPCDDCLPLTPPTSFKLDRPSNSSPFRSSRSRSPSRHTLFLEKQTSKFVETSGLASYRFPATGLATPASSRPTSPSRSTSFSEQLPFYSNRDYVREEEDRFDLGCSTEEEDTDEDEDEANFRRQMLMERSLEFDGDMEEWEGRQFDKSGQWGGYGEEGP